MCCRSCPGQLAKAAALREREREERGREERWGEIGGREKGGRGIGGREGERRERRERREEEEIERMEGRNTSFIFTFVTFLSETVMTLPPSSSQNS